MMWPRESEWRSAARNVIIILLTMMLLSFCCGGGLTWLIFKLMT